MKKIITIWYSFFIVLSCSSTAAAWMSVGVMAGTSVTDSEFSLFWDGEHVSGADYAVINGGTLQAVTSSTREDSIYLSATHATRARYGGDNLQFNHTDALDTEGSLEVWVYHYEVIGASQSAIFNVSNGTSTINTIHAYTNTDGTITLNHKGNSITVTVTSTDTLTQASGQMIQFRWSDTGNTIGVRIGSGSWANQAGTVTAFSNTQNSVALGDYGANLGVAARLYMDDLQVWGEYDAF